MLRSIGQISIRAIDYITTYIVKDRVIVIVRDILNCSEINFFKIKLKFYLSKKCFIERKVIPFLGKEHVSCEKVVRNVLTQSSVNPRNDIVEEISKS